MGKRRSSRELVVKFLYLIDMNRDKVEDQLKEFWEHTPCQKEIQVYADEILHKFFERREDVDRLIEKFSENWTLPRMAVIDRNLLRMAACEILFCRDTPPKVVIDEAVEIAKKYGSADSPNFINGILDRVMKEADNEIVGLSPPK